MGQVGSLYKRRYKGWTPARWTGCYSIRGKRRVVALMTDRAASRAELTRIIAEAERECAGIVDPAVKQSKQPVQVLLDAYCEQCRTMHAPRFVSLKHTYLNRFVRIGRITTIADLTVDNCERVLRAMVEAKKSARTVNLHRATIIAFANDLVRQGKLVGHTLNRLSRRDERVDRRHVRRALTDQEVTALLKTTVLRPLAEYGRMGTKKTTKECKGRATWTKVPLTLETLHVAADRAREVLQRRPNMIARLERIGVERSLLYRLLLTSGMRKGEIMSLTVGQLALNDTPPVLRIPGSKTKNRQDATIPLHPNLVPELRKWHREMLEIARDQAMRAGHPLPKKLHDGTKVFKVANSFTSVLYRDMQVAGIERKNARGIVDVHSMRYTYATNLAKAGVHPRVAQGCLRHSKIDLTLRIYTDLGDISESAKAVASLTVPTAFDA